MAFPARDEFLIPDDVAYLNVAFLGPMSRAAVAAGEVGLARKAHPWTIESSDFFTGAARFRAAVAPLLGGEPEGIAVTPSASYGLATAAANLPLAPGQQVVVLEDQFPSNVYAWQALAAGSAATVVAVDRPADSDWTSAVLEHLDAVGDRAAIVALPHCHWTDGTLVDLVAVGARCRALGAALVVDTAQSLGALPFDVAAVQPDFLVGVTYKWLLGPYSVGFLWAAPHRRAGAPLEHSWLARAGSDDFTSLASYTDEFEPGARRYDMGEASNFALLPAAIAALEQIAGWGVGEIAAHARSCTDRVVAGATELGFTAAGRPFRSGHLVGLRRADLDAERLAATLAEEQVHVSIRGDAVRVSAHVFTTEADVDRLLAALARVHR